MKSATLIFSIFFSFLLIPQAQSKKDPTPVTTIGDFHRSDKISLNPIYENGFWDNLQTKQQKISQIEKIIQEELQVRQSQNYSGWDITQGFINLNGVSDISGYIELEKNSSGNVYDSTYNGKYNVPARTIIGRKDGNQFYSLGILAGDNPLNLNDYYFWNPTTGEKVNLENFDSNGSVLVGSIGNTSQDFFTGMDIIKFKMEDGEQKEIESLRGYVLRNSPRRSFISIVPPSDTTIDRTVYENNPDLLSDDYGVPSVSSNPSEGNDFYFEDVAQNFIEGRIENEVVKSAVDTTYLTPNKDVFKVRIKAKANQLEKNVYGNQRNPGNTGLFEHNLSKDSAYYNITVDLTTGVKEDKPVEKEFNLYQNYPNPFNPTTTIKFTIPVVVETTRRVVSTKLTIYDALGREVKTLLNAPLVPGEYEIKFKGSELPSGIYFYTLTSGVNYITRKMILLK